MLEVLKKIKNNHLFFLLIFAYIPLGFYLNFYVNIAFILLCLVLILTQMTNIVIRSIYIKILALLIIVFLLLIYDFSIINLDFGASILCLLLLTKYLEISSHRDCYIFLFLTSFLPVILALYEQSILTGIYLAFFILGFICSLYYTCTYSKNIKTCFKIFLQSIPLMIILFLFLPRLPSAFIGLAQKHVAHLGLDNKVSPGDISKLVLSDEVVFRVMLNNVSYKLNNLYFRSAVHSRCEKGMCFITNKNEKNIPMMCLSNKIDYEILLEAQYNNFIPILEMSIEVPNVHSISINQGYFFLTSKAITIPIGYRAKWCAKYVLQPASKEEIYNALKIDKNENPKTQELIKQLIKTCKNPYEIVKRILSLYTKDFFYTLDPPKWPQKDPIDFFLFVSKKGFCEHYAVATVYMLRYANIPARVVTGYLGGEKNPLGDYIVVRQSNAHAWVEAFVDENNGFVRIDPTKYIPKENIESSVHNIQRGIFVNENVFVIFSKVVRMLDYINYKWRELVVDYDYKRQRSFFSKIGFDPKDVKTYSIAILIIMIVLFIGLAIVYISLSNDRHKDKIGRYYLIFLKKLRNLGIDIDLTKGPMEILEIVKDKYDIYVGEVEEIIYLYIKMRYREIIEKGDLQKFKEMVRRF